MIKRKDFANLYACGFMFASVCYKKNFFFAGKLEKWKWGFFISKLNIHFNLIFTKADRN